jgi:hypothetical protein
VTIIRMMTMMYAGRGCRLDTLCELMSLPPNKSVDAMTMFIHTVKNNAHTYRDSAEDRICDVLSPVC